MRICFLRTRIQRVRLRISLQRMRIWRVRMRICLLRMRISRRCMRIFLLRMRIFLLRMRIFGERAFSVGNDVRKMRGRLGRAAVGNGWLIRSKLLSTLFIA